jgi:hypothetical protein
MQYLKRLLPVMALLLALPLAAADKKHDPNVRFGMPAPAGTERDAYLIERPQYVLSYNGTMRTPNWASWRGHPSAYRALPQGATPSWRPRGSNICARIVANAQRLRAFRSSPQRHICARSENVYDVSFYDTMRVVHYSDSGLLSGLTIVADRVR